MTRAVDLVKRFEGFSPRTYTDSVGVPTIGYGTTAAAGVGIIPVPGMEISERQAEEYLSRALTKFWKQVAQKITVPLNVNEEAALMSLVYNIGPGAFLKSTLLRKLNKGDRQGAADEFLRWNRAGGTVLKGLERRRMYERSVFLTPPEPKSGWEWALWGLLNLLKGVFQWMLKRRKS